MSSLRHRGYLVENEVKASAQDDSNRLTNIHRTLPPKMLSNIPYKGQSKVKIYRPRLSQSDKGIIQSGEMVALRKTDIARVFNVFDNELKVVEREVNAYDVLWAGQDEYLWYYSPIRGMKG